MKGQTARLALIALAGMVVLGLCAQTASAGPYIPRGPFVVPLPGLAIPTPTQVPGKEYTDFADKDGIVGAPAPGQAILWDGAGGVKNGALYPVDEVDALANLGDALFDSVIANTSALLFSVGGSGSIFYETVLGAIGVWAAPPAIDQHGVTDVDALEVWGPEGAVDANRYSALGDPGGCAVAALGGGCVVTTAVLAAFLGVSHPDLDGLMMQEFTTDILFSIRPTPGGPYNGGEIWAFDYVAGAGGFLSHGGHLWDTAWAAANLTDPAGAVLNVNALEAVSYQRVPEPSSTLLLGSMLAGLGLARRLRRR